MTFQYRVGGSLAYNHPTYVERKADRELLQALKDGKFCYVFNCRQMGKSSLRVRTMHQLQAEGMYCTSVDITSLGSNDNIEQWYNGLITQLFLGLNLARKFNLKAWLREREGLPPPQKLSQFIEELLLTIFPNQKLFIFIDEIDKIISLQFSLDDFFSLIRYFYNQRAENPNYERITFALFGVATPSDLIREKTQTSFNIGQAIELSGFILDEVQSLEEGLKENVEDPRTVLKEILDWTGGQPFLTQKICQLVFGGKFFINRGNEIDRVKQIVYSQIIDNWESQDEPVHLKTIRDRLLRNEQKAGRLLGLYQQILNRGYIEVDGSQEQGELRLSGLVVKQSNKLTIYNPIYQAVFNLEWIEKQLEKLRPYSESIRIWEVSGFQDESRLLRGQALKDALAWSVGKSLSNIDYQFLSTSQNLDKREAELNLETERKANIILSDANRKATQRLRIGTAILLASLIGIFISGRYAWNKQGEVKISNRLQQTSEAALRRFQFEQIQALTYAMQAGEDLQAIVKDRRELQDYPTTSPLSVLQEILANIQEKNQLEGHQKTIYSVSYNPQTDTIATASEDGTVKLWNPQGQEILTLKGHQGAVYGVSFSPDGKLLATASQDKTIKLWNLQGRELKTLRGHEKSVYSVSFSPNNQRIASTSRDETARLWDLQGHQLAVFKGHIKSVDDVSFSPDGKRLATASRDGTVRVWNWQGQQLAILQKSTFAYYSVSYSPDGKRIAATAADGTIKIWDSQGKPLVTWKGHQDYVNNVSFSPDGRWLATASSDGTAKLWDLQGKELATFRGHQEGVFDVDFKADGRRIVTVSGDTTAKIWDISTTLRFKVNPFQRGISSISFSSDRTKIAIAASDEGIDKPGNIYVYDFQGNLIKQFPSNLKGINSISFSPDGNQIVAVANGIKLWNLEGKVIAQFPSDVGTLSSVAFSPDSKQLATGSKSGSVIIWNLEKPPQLLQELKVYDSQISSLAFSSDGRKLAIASKQGEISLWDTENQAKITFADYQSNISQIRFSPDGTRIATASNDGTVKLWNLQGKLLANLEWDLLPVRSVNFSPDGQQIITISDDGTARLWDDNGNLQAELNRYQGPVYEVAFSNNGQEVIAVSREGKIQIWKVETEELVQLEKLLQQGCNWLSDYLNTHPQEREKLMVCHHY